MGVALADIGVEAVYLDNEIELALGKLVRVEDDIPRKFRELASDGCINVFNFKRKNWSEWGPSSIHAPGPGSGPKQESILPVIRSFS